MDIGGALLRRHEPLGGIVRILRLPAGHRQNYDSDKRLSAESYDVLRSEPASPPPRRAGTRGPGARSRPKPYPIVLYGPPPMLRLPSPRRPLMRRPRLLALFFIVLLAAPAALAQSRLTGFGLLRLEPSARASALAGAYGAGPGEDVNALFANPALLGEDDHRALAVSYLNHLADINAGFVTYARQVDRLGGALAGSVRFLSYGDIERADADGNRAGDTFGASDAVISLAYARPL